MIRLTVPSIGDDDLLAVQNVLRTGFLVQGERVAQFEKALAQYVGVKRAVAVSNCTAALHLALLALNIGPGDLVLVTTYSWIATANVIELCGAQPIFVDIEPDSFNMDPRRLQETIEQVNQVESLARRMKAILPVHAFGQMANMLAIQRIADSHSLPIIEDAACALGADLNGKQAGGWGIMGCFSFHPRKAITTGEGGMITTDDEEIANKLQALRNHGQSPLSKEFIMLGYNYRLTEFQAALGLTQLNKLGRIIEARRRMAALYTSLFADTAVQSPVIMEGGNPVYQSYVVLLPERAAAKRDKIIQQMRSEGVETTIGTIHMPLTDCFRTKYRFQPGDFPVTDAVSQRALTLPLYETITEEDVHLVAETLLRAI
jgi:perosamine synthetase